MAPRPLFNEDGMRQMKCGSVVIALGLLLAGCVTINIYFPAAAAEKAADRIIDEVWQLKQSQTEQGKEEVAK